jgi:predicted nucleotide-binding protein (sugar kinase/HSP70/actin superfamily)
LIRVDEITAIGSVRLRLRSLVESLKMTKDREAIKTPRKYIVPFEKEDKRRTILAPHFADMYSPFIPTLFEISGYKLINLPRPDKKSVELGLKYCNNEICYPATIVVGDIVKALQSGEYDRNEIAMGITQTGGQCRASSYLALIKKAMINAGYDDVPIVSLNSGNINNNDQPGFKMDWLKVLPAAFITILFADSISKMYYSLAVREKNKGEAAYLRDYYITKAQPIVKKGSFKDMYALLDLAVDDFNAVEINEGFYPQIGIVGEIYVKYNSFGHLNTVDWLIKQGIEPIVPPIIDFFVSSFVNTDTDIKNNLSRRKLSDIFVKFMEQLSNKYINKTNKRLSRFTYHKPFHNIRDMAAKAERIVSLANQFGEGWQIPAEISSFAEEGVTNVVSLQPFGCIANHVISKGVEKRMKDLYPDLNLLFLDFDDGAGEVNILNRLHFMASSLLKESQVIG